MIKQSPGSFLNSAVEVFAPNTEFSRPKKSRDILAVSVCVCEGKKGLGKIFICFCVCTAGKQNSAKKE